jgi:metallo-beta-lactamase family protein
MQITVFGAANDVTGSCYLLEIADKRLLVDCGMFQGSEKLERMNHIPKALHPGTIDAVILTHGHLDHCGRLPLLVQGRFKGPIYCTKPTARIAELVMLDSAKIQEEDTERENRQRLEEHRPRLEPLYTSEDAQKAAKLFSTVEYDVATTIGDTIQFRLYEAGHILGSACVEVIAQDGGEQRKVLFSGDIGQWNVPILQDPEYIKDQVNMVFMESTYGERNHRSLADTLNEFREAIKTAVARGGKVVIPTFAVGRAQLMLYYIAQMFHDGVIPPIPVYLDSPMAVAATEIYDSLIQYMDEDARSLHVTGVLKNDLQTLHMSLTVDQSKAINHVDGPCIIMAGSGMCNAGRILHHLRNNLGGPNNLVLIVGYQPKGSLGRLLIDGAPTVMISRETVPVRATVKALGGFSAHAGQDDLIRWLQPLAAAKPRVILVHGESHAMDQLAYKIEETFSIQAVKPKLGDVLTL